MVQMKEDHFVKVRTMIKDMIAKLEADASADQLAALMREADPDQSGEIDIQEFFQWLDQPKTSFTLGLFELIDTDNTQSLDFHEFVHALVTFACFRSSCPGSTACA